MARRHEPDRTGGQVEPLLKSEVEREDAVGDGVEMRLQSEVTGVEQPDLAVRQVAPEGFCACGNEEHGARCTRSAERKRVYPAFASARRGNFQPGRMK